MSSSPTHGNLVVALAGQQNAGKSTTFNMLTGANQYIANYPGVTVDKKSGSYRDNVGRVEIVDLPGTYGFSSFSLEERVARDFLLDERPNVILNVVDASTLRRGLHLTVQLIELSFPLVVALNMVDVLETQGKRVDDVKLAARLGVPVIPTVGRKGKGKSELRDAIRRVAASNSVAAPLVSYTFLEDGLQELRELLRESVVMAGQQPIGWIALKLFENDEAAMALVQQHHIRGRAVLDWVGATGQRFESEHGISPADHILACREAFISQLVAECVSDASPTASSTKGTLTEKIDRVVLHRFLSPFFLIATVYLIYELSIVQGYKLTNYTWPILAKARALIAQWLPDPGLLQDTIMRSFGLWMVDSVNTLLNYIPVFLVLFALVAILEDSGYMARIAFTLDKIFKSFGLHGQSTLPYILAGVFTGGCAVPGIMATKGIPDERSRIATILTVPYMNCLAKIPLYTLLVNVYFVEQQSYVMFFLSTITIIIALIVAKLLTLSVLRHHETSPFVMEMPHYHLPTLSGVARRAFDRTWTYIKKIGTIVAAVAVCVYVLLQFPGVSDEQMAKHNTRMEMAIVDFRGKISETAYADQFMAEETILRLLNVQNQYREAKLAASSQEASERIDDDYAANYPDLFPILRARDAETRVISRHLRTLATERSSIRAAIREETILMSYFGVIGKSLEPITQFAGFDWKVNIALISSFAARESSVATLGVLFQEGASENITLEERMSRESGAMGTTPLHALALMIFFVLYPPCLATIIMIKVQTNSYRWMLFALGFSTTFGLIVASAVFTIGSMLALSALQAMGIFYLIALGTAIALSFVKDPAWAGIQEREA